MSWLTQGLLAGGLCLGMINAGAVAGGIEINEIRTDQVGADVDEYFELAGPSGMSLAGLTYLVIGDGAGGSGSIESVTDLSAFSIGGDGFFLAVKDGSTLVGVADAVLASGDFNFENSDNVTHLLVDGFTGADGDDLDVDEDGVLEVMPWAAVLDAVGLVETVGSGEFNYGADLGFEDIGPDGTFVPGHVFRCTTAGAWIIGRFDPVLHDGETPGDVNPACVIGNPCGAGAGDCFVANGSAGCEDATCCNDVCAMDSFCCDVVWDSECATLANANCAGGETCGLPGGGSCYLANGSPGCEDATCCEAVCAIEPLCCSIEWDQNCADLSIQVFECVSSTFGLVINEIHADPDPTNGDANGDFVVSTFDDEFVEIYNGSGSALDISGFQIVDGSELVRHTFPGGTVLEDECAVVVFAGGDPIGVFGGATVQTASEGQLGLNNGGDTVIVLDASGLLVTIASYGGEAGDNQSITLNPDIFGLAYEQHSTIPAANGALFSPGTLLDGNPFAGCNPDPDQDGDGVPDSEDNCVDIANPLQEDCDNDGVGDVCEIADGTQDDLNGNGVPDDCESTFVDSFVINEIHASVDDTGGDANGDGVIDFGDDEFVEIVNITGSDIDITGFTLSDENGLVHTFGPTIVPANCCVVVFGGGNLLGDFCGATVQTASEGALNLSNGGDTVFFDDDLGLPIQAVSYGAEGGDNQSITRDPDITGGEPLVRHTQVNAALLFSPGRLSSGNPFSGCAQDPNDLDCDGITNDVDNCPNNWNPDQEDCDGDGIGDACETDPDKNGNGIPDNCEVDPASVQISELRTNEPGTDTSEYFELSGTPNESLDGLTYIVIGDSGSSGVIEAVISLDGLSLGTDGLLLVAESTFALTGTVDFTTDLNFENSDHVTHCIVANFGGANGDDLDDNDDGILDSTPWSEVVDAVGLIVEPQPPVNEEWAYGEALGFVDVGPDGTFVPSQVYRCTPTGEWTVGLFDPFGGTPTDTPDAANLACGGGGDCPEDLNDDTFVNISDLLILLSGWGSSGPGDIDMNGIVDINDLLDLLAAWGPCDP